MTLIFRISISLATRSLPFLTRARSSRNSALLLKICRHDDLNIVTVLQFHYTAVQLNRLPWRQFVTQPNPAATALMTKMLIAESDCPKVKAQCLRLLVTLKLTPGKAELIYVFIESYLKLTAAENHIYEQELGEIGTSH